MEVPREFSFHKHEIMRPHQTLCIVISIFSFQFASAQCIDGNCSNGWGTFEWESGDTYTGEWVNGSRTGIGAYDWKDGSFYYGYFRDGKLEGDGFYIGLDSKKDRIGLFHNRHLSKKKNFSSSGCVLGNCIDGSGIYLWASNDLYIGEFKNGERTGYGRYDWDDGSWYLGYFKDGKLDGEGEYHTKDKEVIKGPFVYGEIKGSSSSSNISKVKIIDKNGIKTIPVKINGLPEIDFILDTGASETLVTADVVLTMLRLKLITEKDFLPGETYILADGSEVKSKRFNINNLEVGGVNFTNVSAAIGNVHGEPLLGQNVLSQFKSVQQDNANGYIIFEK
jgi:hypothetical protein